MRIKLLLALITGFLFSSFAVNAQEQKKYDVPIEWQKVELQDRIKEDVIQAVSAVIDGKKFLVHVEVGVSAAQSFGAGKKATGGQDFPLAKLGLNKNSSAYQKAISVTGDSVFSRVGKISIQLSVDTSVTQAQENQARNLVATVLRSYTTLRAAISVRRMVFVSDESARARNLEVARVNIEAAKAIGEAITASNEKIAQAINAAQGMAQGKDGETVVRSPNELPTDWKEILVLFRLPLGIILATFILAMLISGFKKFEGQKIALMAQANQQARAAAEAGQDIGGDPAPVEDVDAEEVAGGGAVGSGGLGAGESGFDQFKRIAEHYAETAAYLVKTWVNMDTKESRQALAAVTKMVPVDSLVGAMGSLDQELKIKLKKASLTPLDASGIQEAEGFIIDQMVENFLVNTVELPDNLKTLISTMTMHELVECIKLDAQLGGAFVNVLQTGQVGRLVSMLSEEEVSNIFSDGLKFTNESIQYLEGNLPQALENVRMDKKQSSVPLVEKGIELIKMVGPEKEHEVFNMLISSGDHGKVIEATRLYFPASLILNLPPDALRILINRLPMARRASLIVSRPEEEQQILYAAVGETGRLREIIDTEVNEIIRNEKTKLQIEKEKSKIWEQFIKTSRETIRTDSRVKDAASELVENWLLEKGVDTQKEQSEQAA